MKCTFLHFYLVRELYVTKMEVNQTKPNNGDEEEKKDIDDGKSAIYTLKIVCVWFRGQNYSYAVAKHMSVSQFINIFL